MFRSVREEPTRVSYLCPGDRRRYYSLRSIPAPTGNRIVAAAGPIHVDLRRCRNFHGTGGIDRSSPLVSVDRAEMVVCPRRSAGSRIHLYPVEHWRSCSVGCRTVPLTRAVSRWVQVSQRVTYGKWIYEHDCYKPRETIYYHVP